MKLLKEQLAINYENIAKQLPKDTLSTMSQATLDLKKLDIENIATKTNAIAPEFNLINHKNEDKSLKEYLDNGVIILSFYRGGWCPYCNLELRALQQLLPEIEKTGTKLVAISPEVPDQSISTHEMNHLTFDILYDQGNKVAKQFGLVFKLPEVLRPIYDNFGINIPDHNGDNTFELPIPATYVINQQGKIIYHFIDPDYTIRSEPSEIVKIIKNTSLCIN
ncbi:MAG: AhpC/TSA family protein [Methylococcales bacterium]|nr:AhpC/TSA family protein [Methylococcales bacterium]